MSASEKLIEQRDALVLEASTALAGEATPEANALAESRMAEADALDVRIATAKKVEERTAAIEESRKAAGVSTFATASGVTVGKEPLTYAEHSGQSFARDMIRARGLIGGIQDPESIARLQRHSKEMVEERAISSAAAAGGEFVPPLWLLNDYAEFARAARVGANLVNNLALPAGTDSINIPQITTGTLTALQAGNNQTATTRDMVTASVAATVETVAGYEDVSIQLIEQSPLSGGIDKLVFGDLMADYALQVNTAVVGAGSGTSHTLKGLITLGTDTTNGIPTTWTETTPTATNMVVSIQKALSVVARNRFRAAEAILMNPAMWYWLNSQVDSNGRPLVLPNVSGPYNAQGINGAPATPSGAAGSISGVSVFLDATMPLTYATNQSPILVGKFSDSYLFEGGIKTGVFPDVNSATLGVRFRVYGYVALAHRYAKAVSAITGTGTVAPSGF